MAWTLWRVVRHCGIALLAHAAAAISAGVVLSTALLLLHDETSRDAVDWLALPAAWAGMSFASSLFIWMFTLPAIVAYPLALWISRRHATRATVATGVVLGALLGLGIWGTGPGADQYPGLTPDEYRALHLDFLLSVLPAGIAAGATFGWVSSRLDRTRSRRQSSGS